MFKLQYEDRGMYRSEPLRFAPSLHSEVPLPFPVALCLFSELLYITLLNVIAATQCECKQVTTIRFKSPQHSTNCNSESLQLLKTFVPLEQLLCCTDRVQLTNVFLICRKC